MLNSYMKPKKFLKISSQLYLPFLETNRNLIEDIFETLKCEFGLIKNSNQKFIDLGSGNGQIVIFSALNYGIKSIGIEINQDLIREAKTRIKSFKKDKSYPLKWFRKIKLIHGDLFELNLNSFDFIYIFTLPTMQKFLRHVLLSIKKNSIIISYKFPLGGFEDIINMEYELKNEYKNQLISTFFYRRI